MPSSDHSILTVTGTVNACVAACPLKEDKVVYRDGRKVACIYVHGDSHNRLSSSMFLIFVSDCFSNEVLFAFHATAGYRC